VNSLSSFELLASREALWVIPTQLLEADRAGLVHVLAVLGAGLVTRLSTQKLSPQIPRFSSATSSGESICVA
jgi:hypothetical protein